MTAALRRWAAGGLASGLALVPAAGWAHGEIRGIGAFYSGVLHPLLSPAHLIALLLLGLLFGQRGVHHSRAALAGLAAALAAGLVATLWLGERDGDRVLLPLALAMGLAVIAARRLPAPLLVACALAVGAAVGLGSGPEGVVAGRRFAALAGTFVGAALCTACVAGAVHAAEAQASDQRPWARIGVRVVASWMTAAALLVLVLAAVPR